jgi:RNA-directed DNA polymerase
VGNDPHSGRKDYGIGITRKRCWQHDWVLEFDIKGLFDNIPHALLLKAVRRHVQDKWALLCIERWLTAPMEVEDGKRLERDRGTPQGGVVSPVLANLFMHYTFDAWMQREHPDLPWCRYADDGLVHCRTLNEAEDLKLALQKRLAECGLEMHPDKTRIVFCKNGRRKGKYPNKSFDFLGYTFRPRRVITKEDNSVFDGFAPAVSRAALRTMRKKIAELNLRRRTQIELKEALVHMAGPRVIGWSPLSGSDIPMPHKHNADRRHHIPKMAFKVGSMQTCGVCSDLGRFCSHGTRVGWCGSWCGM